MHTSNLINPSSRSSHLAVRLALSLSLVAVGACSSPASNDDNTDDVVVYDATPRPDGIPGETYSLSWGEVTVQPGEEDTRCVTLELSNTEEIKVRAMHNELGDTSHHLIVYRDNSGAEINETPTPCQPFAGTLNPSGMVSPIMVTQRASETLQLPAGVAYTFQAHQRIRLEMHYINATDAPLTATAVTDFTAADPTWVTDEADFLFIGNPDIDIPANGTQTLSSYFRMPPSLYGANIFAITGHTHKMGIDMQVSTRASAGAADVPVYSPEVFSWDEPDTERHEPAFVVPNGGGFQFSCEYVNTSNSAIGFGESANDEMCFFWAYYYPSVGSKVCVHTDQIAGGFDLCCPDAGAAICGMIGL